MAYQSGNAIQVIIHGPGPWGFRLAGGKDFNIPLHISKITPGGKAAIASLLPNDTVTSIDGCDTSVLTHLEAQNKIKSAVGDLHLNISRGDSKIWKPKITDDFSSGQPSVNVSLAADKQKFTHAGSAHNVAAKPFPGSAGGGPGGGLGTATVVHKQFNSPVGIYSSENIAETFKGQTEGMITGALGGDSSGPAGYGGGGGAGQSNYDTGSPVYKAMQAEQSGEYGHGGYPSGGTQSRSFKMLQQMTEADEADYGQPASQPPAPAPAQQPQQQKVTRSVKAPTTKPGAGGPKPDSTLPMCEGCNRAIVGKYVHVNPPDEERPRRDGPFVKVRNRSLHPECFKCQTCGCSLRNQGYFWVEGGMYCEKDAKAKASAPPGSNVVLSSSPASGGVPNGTSVPTPAQPVRHAPQPRAPQQYAPQQPAPVRHAPQQPATVQHAPQQPAPVRHAPQQHAPQLHTSQSRGPPRSQPVPVKHSKARTEPVKKFRPAPTPPANPAPRFQKKPQPDPNAVIAMALARNPVSEYVGDLHGNTEEPVKHIVFPHQTPPSRPPPPPPVNPKPRFQRKPQTDPNAIIAKALAKNPDSTKDCLGIQPVFTVQDTVRHEVSPDPPPTAPRLRKQRPQDPGAPQDGVRVMFLPNNGAGGKQTPSQVAHQTHSAPKPNPSPPRSTGPPQGQRPGPTFHPSAPAISRGPSAPSPAGSRGPTKMVDSGTRTPVCDGCNAIIKGPFVSAIGRNWHPEHFVCAHCHGNLKDKTFVEEKGKIFCEEDFVKLYADKCHKCHKNIAGPGVSALGGKFHPECFVCEQCKEPISGGKFRLSDGKPYCERDYRAQHSTMCSGCEFIIDPGDPWLEALEKAWHANCFVCSICQSPLEGQSFYAKMGRPFCQTHAN